MTRAIALTGPRTLSTMDLPTPGLDSDGAVLRIEACGVCGSDVPPFETGEIDGFDVACGPVVLGHEMVGRIEAIGPVAARRWGVQVGDRVVAERAIPCGHCERCLTGNYQMCRRPSDELRVTRYGSTPVTTAPGLWGGYAEAMYLHPDSTVFQADTQADAEELAFFTPLSNGLSWVMDAGRLRMGETIVIQGPGQQGLACVIAAAQVGGRQIIVTGLADDAVRLVAASKLGATDVVQIEPDAGSAVEAVTELTGGRGADLVIDTTSGRSAAPVADAVQMAAEQGRIVLATGHEGGVAKSFDVERFWSRRLSMTGVRSRRRWAVSTALELIASGRVSLDAVPSLALSLDRLEYGLQVMAGEVPDERALHVTVTP